MPLRIVKETVIMKTRLATFFALLLGLSATAADVKPESGSIQTPDGPINVTRRTVEPVPQKVELVGVKQRLAFDALSSQAGAFVLAYVPAATSPTLKDFDEAFRRWQKETKPRYTQQQVVEVLGAYLGNRLIADFQMEWVEVTDQHGTDYAVRGKEVEVMSFPFSSVAKRIRADQYDFMAGVYYTVQDAIASGRYKKR